jgi:hypothetical protein
VIRDFLPLTIEQRLWRIAKQQRAFPSNEGKRSGVRYMPFGSLRRNRSVIWFAADLASTRLLMSTSPPILGNVLLRPRSALIAS